jgi:hypothetical protein
MLQAYSKDESVDIAAPEWGRSLVDRIRASGFLLILR